MAWSIGIDLGGTNIRGALWQSGTDIHHRLQGASGPERSPEDIIQTILELINKLSAEVHGAVESIGIGVPGIVDFEASILRQSPHFPKVKDFPLRQQLMQHVSVPLYIDNDANCAALGEAQFGAGQSAAHLMMLTLGTGIGGGIVWDDEVIRGDYGYAAEFGHIVLSRSGPHCHCGSNGCFEMYASATGLTQLVRDAPLSDEKQEFLTAIGKQPFEVTPVDLAQQAEAGQDFAKHILSECGRYLGMGIASLVHVLGIHTVVIGGGVSHCWAHFESSMWEEFRNHSYHETAKVTQLLPAKLGDDAGILGAAYGATRMLD